MIIWTMVRRSHAWRALRCALFRSACTAAGAARQPETPKGAAGQAIGLRLAARDRCGGICAECVGAVRRPPWRRADRAARARENDQ